MPRRLLAVAAGLVLSACGASTEPRQESSAGPSSSASASATGVSSPTPTPTGMATSCRVPIARYGGEGTNGFVTYPAGTFVAAEAANPPIPAGYSPAGSTYDRAFEKWLPVPPDWVTADGRRYAYASRVGGMGAQPAEPGLHVVDLSTATDKRVAAGDWQVVGFNAHGVYAMQASQNASPSGLWVIDPDSGALQQITQKGFWTHITNNLAWGRHAEQPGGILPLDHLFRLDLVTGGLDESWFSRDGMALYALGDDARGNVVVQATGGASDALEFWLVGQQSPQSTQIYVGSAAGQFSLVPVALVALGDGHGLWFGTYGGLYLYRAGEPVAKVSEARGQVAGICERP